MYFLDLQKVQQQQQQQKTMNKQQRLSVTESSREIEQVNCNGKYTSNICIYKIYI